VLGIGWFSSARDRAALDLFDAVQNGVRDGRILLEIRYVFSNRSPGSNPLVRRLRGRAEREDIPFIALPSSRFRPEARERGRQDGEILREWRIAYDRAVMEKLSPFETDLIVLAGYMLVVGPEMCSRYPMINLHPALPTGPPGSWQTVIRTLIRSRARETGVMIHLATERLDAGPPLTFCRFSIRNDPFRALWRELEGKDLGNLADREVESTPLFREIRRQGVSREIPLLLATLADLSRGRLRIQDRRVFQGSRELPHGLDLTSLVEATLNEGRLWP
jgi:phosphoribosylglycinamide formyltransferase-1